MVSLHPYFKAHPGKLPGIQPLLQEFVNKTASEAKVLHYDFTLNGDEIFCRETYQDADGILAHLANVEELLKQMLTMADLVRVEVHGPAEELDKLREPLAGLSPAWFVLQCALARSA